MSGPFLWQQSHMVRHTMKECKCIPVLKRAPTHTTHLVSSPARVSKDVDDWAPAAQTSVEGVGAVRRGIVVLQQLPYKA